MSKTRQSGSVTTFIIIGAVLAVLTIGTAYAVVRRGEQVRRDQAIASANQAAKTTDSKAIPSSDKTGNNSVTQPSSGAAKTTTVPSATADNTTSQSQSQASADLPVTGPELSPIASLPIALIVGFAVAYGASRRRSIRTL